MTTLHRTTTATPPSGNRVKGNVPLPLTLLPDPPRKRDMLQFIAFTRLAVANTVTRYYDALRPDANILVAGEGYLCATRRDLPHAPYPDMLIAFGVDAAAIAATNGYVIDEVGKPPDFVLEVASASTGRRDYTVKRIRYARLGVLEYWRFDHTGGRFHNAPLAGDRLVNGHYEPIATETDEQGRIWGHSAALGLWLCWDAGRLRFHDGVRFLEDPSELAASRDAERTARDAERTARLSAEVQRDAARDELDLERQARLDAQQEREQERQAHLATQQERDLERQARLDAQHERDALLAEIRRLRDAGQQPPPQS